MSSATQQKTGCQAKQGEDPLAALREASVTLRQDLVVSRLMFQGEPSYMVHDPVSFQNQRLSLQDYEIVTRLREDRKLGDCFNSLISDGRLDQEDEKDFYQFIVKLQRLGVLSLPFSNGKVLYEQQEKMTLMKKKGGPMKFLFMTIPLANPDAFLSRTMPLFRWLFTKAFFVIWLLAGLSALAIVLARIDEFLQPFNALLATKNVLFMTGAFLLLKVWHELGHGYACKVFGGRIPEMGMMLMAGMPLAYVDASAAWNFSKRRHRLTVMLGGMFFESLVAIPAAFLWALDSTSFWGSCAYQLIFMAGVTTLLFNANPLMRYDGYFVLSELLGIPNLRKRATTEVSNTAKKLFLGLPTPTTSSWGLKFTLLTYGILASLYRTTVVLSIATMLALKFFVVGIGLAALHIGTTIWTMFGGLCKYLLFADETKPCRTKATAYASVVMLGVPACLAFMPVLGGVTVTGVVSAENEYIVRAEEPGILRNLMVEAHGEVDANSALAELENMEAEHAESVARASLQHRLLEHQLALQRDRVAATRIGHEVGKLKYELLDAQKRTQELTVRAPQSGRIAFLLPPQQRGSFLQAGDVIAKVVNGKTVVRVWLDDDHLQATAPQTGDTVECRFSDQIGNAFSGKILTVAPASNRQIEDEALTTLAGGDITVNPANGETIKPWYRVDIEVPEHGQDGLSHESLSRVKLRRRYEPVGYWITRKCRQFINKLLIG